MHESFSMVFRLKSIDKFNIFRYRIDINNHSVSNTEKINKYNLEPSLIYDIFICIFISVYSSIHLFLKACGHFIVNSLKRVPVS